MASPAGLFSIKPWAIAHRITVRMRCRTRRAVSGLVLHTGVKTLSTSACPIRSTRKLPRTEKACRSRVFSQERVCFSLRHRGRFASWTFRAASWNVGTGLRRFSATGSPIGYGGAIRGCKPPGLGEANGCVSTQTEVPAVAVNHSALYPGLRPGGSDIQIKPGPVAIPAWFGGRLDLDRSKLWLILFPDFPTPWGGLSGTIKELTTPLKAVFTYGSGYFWPLSYSPGHKSGGAGGNRTRCLFNAIEALSQMSYSPTSSAPPTIIGGAPSF